MATQDKVLLMHKVEDTLRTRMFANLLDEATTEIQGHLDEFDVVHIAGNEERQSDLLESYIEAKRTEGRSEKTLVRYQYVIERFMKAVGLSERNVTTFHVRDYIAKEQERGISDSTLEGIRECLNAYFSWLEHEKLIVTNPVFNVSPIKCQKKVREALSQTDIEKLKRVCTGKRDAALINFLLSTGCRVSEVVALNRNDVDFDTGECVVLGKGNKERTVYLNEVAIMTLREYLASRSDNCEALFVGKDHVRFHQGGIRVMLNHLAEKAGVEHVHPHRFRRTLITRLLNNGMQIHEVAIVAGHDKLDTTMEYFHMDKNRIKSSYNRFMS